MALGNQFIQKIEKKVRAAPYKRKQSELSKKITRRQPLSRTQEQSRFAAARSLEATPVHWVQQKDPNQLTIPWNDEDGTKEPQHRSKYAEAVRLHREDETYRNFEVVDVSPNFTGRVASRRIRGAFQRSGLPTSSFEDLAHVSVVDDGKAFNPNNARPAYSSGYRSVHNGEKVVRGYNRYSPHLKRDAIVIHETAHVADRMARGTGNAGIPGDRSVNMLSKTIPISPSAEGYADGIAMRFSAEDPTAIQGPPATELDHLGILAYSPKHFDTDEKKAMFVASKAHAYTSGQLTQGANMSEAVHNAGSNPSVRQAIRANKMTSIAKNLSEQFMATRKQGTQLSLLGSEDEYDVYDVDDVDWDN